MGLKKSNSNVSKMPQTTLAWHMCQTAFINGKKLTLVSPISLTFQKYSDIWHYINMFSLTKTLVQWKMPTGIIENDAKKQPHLFQLHCSIFTTKTTTMIIRYSYCTSKQLVPIFFPGDSFLCWNLCWLGAISFIAVIKMTVKTDICSVNVKSTCHVQMSKKLL